MFSPFSFVSAESETKIISAQDLDLSSQVAERTVRQRLVRLTPSLYLDIGRKFWSHSRGLAMVEQTNRLPPVTAKSPVISANGTKSYIRWPTPVAMTSQSSWTSQRERPFRLTGAVKGRIKIGIEPSWSVHEQILITESDPSRGVSREVPPSVESIASRESVANFHLPRRPMATESTGEGQRRQRRRH